MFFFHVCSMKMFSVHYFRCDHRNSICLFQERLFFVSVILALAWFFTLFLFLSLFIVRAMFHMFNNNHFIDKLTKVFENFFMAINFDGCHSGMLFFSLELFSPRYSFVVRSTQFMRSFKKNGVHIHTSFFSNQYILLARWREMFASFFVLQFIVCLFSPSLA